MKHVKYCAILAVPLLTVACGQAPDNALAEPANAATSASATEAAPANLASADAAPANAAAAAPGPLSAYVGKYPFDPVNGVSFLAQPSVRAAVQTAVPSAAIRAWVLDRAGPQAPIALRDGRLIAWGCETHNCGPHQWTILIGPDGSAAEICYHDDRQDPAHSLWYAAGRPPETRPGSCTPA
jgi:hypothetical protein